MSDVRLKTLSGGTTTVAGASLDALSASLRGSVCRPGEPGYDEARTIWNAMIDRRPGVVVRCADAADVTSAVRFAREQRPAARGARRRSQHRGQRGLRRRSPDRSFADEGGARRSGQADRPGRAGGHARRARPGDPGLRPRDPGRHQFHHRHRRAHAGRRLRLDQPQARPHGRQPARRRRGDRRRRAAPHERERASRPVLGDPRRRRQFRRRDLVRVPAPPDRARGAVRPDRASLRRGPTAVRRLPPLRRRGARRADRLGGAAQGAAAAVSARGLARQGSHGAGTLLRRRHGGGREGGGTTPGARQADRRRRRSAPLRRLAGGLRSAAHAGRAQLLEVARLRRRSATPRSRRSSTTPAGCRRPNARSSSPTSAVR